ncbi:MAG: class I SAM-dependent methyltransferase [Spirochaetota bacterium]
MKLYHELAENYFDMENHTRNIRTDITFVKTFIPVGEKARILDLGCGTGEHCALFARDGYSCVGIDSSEDMLRIAQQRNASPQIQYAAVSVTAFDYFEEFDIITSFCGSLDYLLSDDEVDAVLWNTWRALKQSGLAVFEIWNAEPLNLIRKKDLGFVSSTNSGRKKIDRERGFAIVQSEPETLVEVNYRYHITENGKLRMIEDSHTMRAFTLDEAKIFAAKNGFRLKCYYANTQKEGFSRTSNRLVVVLEK